MGRAGGRGNYSGVREVSCEVKSNSFVNGIASACPDRGGQRRMACRASNVTRRALSKMNGPFLFFIRRIARGRLRELRDRISEYIRGRR